MMICRTCLSAEKLSNIFETYNSTQINSATGIVVQENDGLPQMICKTCKHLLTSALQLREQSLYAERVLLEELNSCIKQENMHRDQSTDSENGITHFRQANSVKNRVRKKIKVERKSCVSNTNITSSKRNMRNNGNAKTSRKINTKSSSFMMKDNYRHLEIDIKVENVTESNDLQDQTAIGDPFDDFLQEIAQIPNPKVKQCQSNISKTEELQQMYKIIDQELERSKTKYKSTIDVKEALKKDRVLDLLTPHLKSLLPDPERNIHKSKRPHTKQTHDKTKLAKLWALAVKPIDRKKLVQCSVCPKLFKYNYFLRHASIHLEREFTCEVCGGKFVHVHALRFHQQRRHGAVRKHACAQCDYSAVQKEELLNHVNRVHTGLRPFICDVCGDGFCQRRTLVQHMRKHYGVKRHRCEFCDKLFTSMSQLGAHRKQYHLMRYTFLCYVCPYRSTGRDTVRRHLSRVHGIARQEQQALKLLKEKR